MIIKVDRVSSIQEAFLLEKAGVNIISVSLISKDERYRDDRSINSIDALNIRKSLRKAEFALEISNIDFSQFLTTIELIQPNYVQFSLPSFFNNELPSLRIKEYLKNAGIKIIYSGIIATYDDDPSWILELYRNEYSSTKNISFFQIELLGELNNAWNRLLEAASKYPEELQLNDILYLGNIYPILISLNFNKKNIIDFLKKNTTKGISMTLCDEPNSLGFHVFSFNFAIQILKKIAHDRRSM